MHKSIKCFLFFYINRASHDYLKILILSHLFSYVYIYQYLKLREYKQNISEPFIIPYMSRSEIVEVTVSLRNGMPGEASPAISAPPFQLHRSPSMTRSPLLSSAPKTPKSPFTSRVLTPIASPMKKAITSMQSHLEEVAHLTKLNPQDDWLPVTESRNGNVYYSAFHTLSSGINGAQALLLPFAFTALGW